MAATDFESLANMIDVEIPEGRRSLQENYSNLERVAKYCESNYLQVSNTVCGNDECTPVFLMRKCEFYHFNHHTEK